MIIPMASVAFGFTRFSDRLRLLVVLMFYYGVRLSINILMLPVLVILTSFLAIGIGMWMSALNVKYPRYSLCFAVFDSTRNVCHADYLSVEARAGKMALAVVS